MIGVHFAIKWEMHFTGDSYLPQYSLVTNFPKSNKEQALDSLEWIKVLSIGCNIYPGHGDIVYV